MNARQLLESSGQYVPYVVSGTADVGFRPRFLTAVEPLPTHWEVEHQETHGFVDEINHDLCHQTRNHRGPLISQTLIA